MRNVNVVPVALSLGLMLAACGQSNLLPAQNGNSQPEPSKNVNLEENSKIHPERVAQYLLGAGFTKEDAQRVAESLRNIEKSGLKSQSIEAQASLKQNLTETELAMQLILDDKVNLKSGSSIAAQTVQRQQVVDSAYNISLNSRSNFEYYQNIRYLETNPGGVTLDYTDDGCSSSIFFAAARYLFNPACDQHDFGYRNGLFYEIHNSDFKRAVDGVLLNNSKTICENYYYGFIFTNDRLNCIAEAEAFYVAVTLEAVNNRWLLASSK